VQHRVGSGDRTPPRGARAPHPVLDEVSTCTFSQARSRKRAGLLPCQDPTPGITVENQLEIMLRYITDSTAWESPQ
jgi:hypothetical protein